MAENLIIGKGTRKDQYESLLPQVKALLQDEVDMIACMANVSAALKAQFDFFWVGFYIVREDELVLGPFQGPIACIRIKKDSGVCGASWARAETIVVSDVDSFPGHIACNNLSRSEIVVPIILDSAVKAVLDIDSDALNDFDQIDAYYLNKIVQLLPLGDY